MRPEPEFVAPLVQDDPTSPPAEWHLIGTLADLCPWAGGAIVREAWASSSPEAREKTDRAAFEFFGAARSVGYLWDLDEQLGRANMIDRKSDTLELLWPE